MSTSEYPNRALKDYVLNGPPQTKLGGPSHNLGLKLILICGLILLMAIPAMFISYISYERSNRADEVAADVSRRYGGPQAVMGPMVVAPYSVQNRSGTIIETGDYIVFAETGHAEFGDMKTTIRKRSLFKVPTYQGDGKLMATFKPLPKMSEASAMQIDWDAAQIVISLSDVRGLKSDITLTDGAGQLHRFEPVAANRSKVLDLGERAEGYSRRASFTQQLPGRLMSVNAAGLIAPDGDTTLSVDMTLGGAQSLSVLPFARSTTARIAADWADPGFSGAFPPVDRVINADGFDASWSVPRLARNMPGAGFAHALPLHDITESAMQVSFIDTHSSYKTVNRALKYAVLFIGLVFLSYFLFEVIVGIAVHPAQYILIGLAQSIFYLLLLAFSEHVGFTAAFIVAAGATISATAGYAGAVFKDRRYALRTGAVFTLVYGLLFTLMKMQDFALMVGALTSFIAIAGTMYLTRNVNWYGERAAAPSEG